MKQFFTFIGLLLFANTMIFGQDSYSQTFTNNVAAGDVKDFSLNFSTATNNPCFDPFAAFSVGEMSQNQLDNMVSNESQWFAIKYGTDNMITIEFDVNHYWEPFGGTPFSLLKTQAQLEWNQITSDIELTISENPPLDIFLGGMGTKTFSATFPVNTFEPTMWGNNIYGALLKLTFYESNWPNNIAFETATMVLATGKFIENNPAWTTQAPAAVQMILRDPPGDASYSYMENTTTNCHGYKVEVATDESAEVYASAKIGVAGSAGFLIESSSEVYAELSGGITMGRNQVATNEHQVCFTTTSSFQTDDDNGSLTGSSGDIFIGKSITYAYGIYRELKLSGCYFEVESTFTLAPAVTADSTNSFVYSEYHIKNNVIPNLQTEIDGLTVGSAAWELANDQMEMWVQAIAQNDAIKTEAIASQSPTNTYGYGVGGTQEFTESISTTDSKSMYMNLYIDAYVGAEVGADIGGSGATAGFKLRTRIDRGTTGSSSTTSTNTLKAHFEDNTVGDEYLVKVYEDRVYGSPIYVLDSINSKTSCPYEGGIQRDQPRLVFEDDTQSVTINNIPSGTPATFTVKICNNSDEPRTYYLKGNASTNLSGAVIEGFGNNLFSTNDDGVEFLNVPANDCLENATITLTQANTTVLDYENIELSLYVLCQPTTDPISSSILLNAHYEEPTAIDDLENAISLEVFPNPNHGQFNIQINGSNENGLLILTDMTGRKIFEKTIAKGEDLIEINQKNLPQGVCFLSFVNDKHRAIRKVVIE
ncbi:MAG: T9SS type A sorting domain-containing protein [Saprospiraceae bacterium]